MCGFVDETRIYETGLQCLTLLTCTFFSCYFVNHDISYFLCSLQPTLSMVFITFDMNSRTQMKIYIVTVILAGWLTAIAPAREVRVGEGRFPPPPDCNLLGYDSMLSSVWLPCTKLQVGNSKDSSLTFHDSVNLIFHICTAHYTKVCIIMKFLFV